MQILDFHCHVYPHAIAEKASDAVARFYQVHRGVEIPDQTAALRPPTLKPPIFLTQKTVFPGFWY